MVEWQGEITRENSGAKAYRLDQVENFSVPNFFTIEKKEMQRLAGDNPSGNEVMESEFPEDLVERIEKAYENVGMTSEVREASGKARSLVGGQRNNQLVSVRVSGEREGVFKFRLDIGASGLENAIKEVAASFYTERTSGNHPAIIIQKMVDPDHSGAVITDYLGDKGLLESVEGLGISLEEGITSPSFYLWDDGIRERSIPEEQLRTTRNPMNGGHRKNRKEVSNPPFDDEEVEELFREAEREEFNLKFAYKRGTFYVVDAFPRDNSNPFEQVNTSLKGIKVSKGEINGEIGRGIAFADESVPPEKYSKAAICRKGGYSSTDAQKARNSGKPAIFSFRGELERNQTINIGSKEVDPGEKTLNREKMKKKTGLSATEVIPLDGQGGLSLKPPLRGARYAVTSKPVEDVKKIPPQGYLDSYSKVFSSGTDRIVLDARKLEKDGLTEAMDYVEADLKILAVQAPENFILEKAIENGFDAVATSSDLEELSERVERAERSFILQRMRELSK